MRGLGLFKDYALTWALDKLIVIEFFECPGIE